MGKKLAVFLTCAGLVLAALTFLILPDTASWREKVTLTVQTPTGIVSTSGVRGYTLVDTQNSLIPEAKGVRTESTGEAIPLEVAPGKWVFVLFGGSYHHSFVKPDWRKNGGVDGHVRLLNATIGQPPLELGPSGVPLGTFLDIDVPDSFRFVRGDRLEEFFGPGYTIVSATVEITKEPVTKGETIKVLDWWMNYRSGPYNEMAYLRVPDEDNRQGWRPVGSNLFWSLDFHQEMKNVWERTHGVN